MKKLFFFVTFICASHFLFAQWPTNGNDIYNQNTGNVGIGTSTPGAKLDVHGDIHSNAIISSDAPSAGAMNLWLRGYSTGNANMVLSAFGGSSQFYWITGADGLLKIGGTGGTEPAMGAINIPNTGGVGIGTTTPGASLEVRSPGVWGSSAGTAIETARFGVNSGNYSQLRFLVNRFAAGSDWLTASTRIQATTDGSNFGYVDFNPQNGLFGIAFGSGVNEIMRLNANGAVGIGTTNTGSFKLAVEGALGARSVKVTLTNPWPDYVFKKKYSLLTLDSLEKYIAQNDHLPGIPSAKEVQQNGGVDLGDMNARLLEKVEELTLYMIQLKKENEEIKAELKKVLGK